MVSLLPTVTSVSGINADAGPAASITTTDSRKPTTTARGLRRIGPSFGTGGGRSSSYYPDQRTPQTHRYRPYTISVIIKEIRASHP